MATASSSGVFHHTAVGINFENSENEQPFHSILGAKCESFYTNHIDELDLQHCQGFDLVTSKGNTNRYSDSVWFGVDEFGRATPVQTSTNFFSFHFLWIR